MLATIAIKAQRTVWNGWNTCFVGTMERLKVTKGPEGEETRRGTKDLDLILWVMGNH